MRTLTRLEWFIRSRKIKHGVLAREANCSRQHLTEIRAGRREPRRPLIASIVTALRRRTLEPIEPDDVFELSIEESGVWERRQAALELRRSANSEAAAFVAGLAGQSPDRWRALLASATHIDLAALVRALILEAKRAVDVATPAIAAQLARVAAEIDLPTTAAIPEYATHLRGIAWLEHANALRHAGAYEEGLRALDLAEPLLVARQTSTSELAQTWYVRAAIEWKRSNFELALLLCQRAERVLELVADIRHLIDAQILDAGILFERGEHSGARDLWRRVVEPLRAATERRRLAAVWMNLGTVEGYLGNTSAAKNWLEKSAREFRRLGVRIEQARAQWSLGHLIGIHESWTRGLALLRDARRSFDELGMPLEGAFVGLDLAEVLVLKPEGAIEAAAVCSAILKTFEQENLAVAKLKAVGYLCTAIRARQATVALVQYVRTYIEAVDRDPREIFAPPPLPVV